MTREPNEYLSDIEILEVEPQESVDFAKPVEEHDRNKGEQATSDNNDRSEYDDYIFTKYHGKHKSFLGVSANHNNTSYSAKNHFVKEVRSKHKRHHRKPWWKKLLIILCIILASLAVLSAIAVGVFFVIKESGISQLTGTKVEMTAPIIESAGVSVDNSKNTITYQGTTYAYNNDMTSILCMGVDKRDGLGLEDEDIGKGGQADALYLVAMDTKTGKTTVIAISRDIYSDIGVYSADGVYTGTEKAQLCLAYAYGDGKETSCENTVNAVERLFYNLPVNSYFAMDMYAIGELNDAIGGVYVTLEDDYMFHGMDFYGRAGDTVRLQGDYARAYLQYRDVNELNSSVDRMNRQINYLEKFAEKAIYRTKKDLGTPVTLFEIVKDNSSTNLNASKISALGYTVATSGANVEFKKVPGEVIHNGEYAEYIVDEQGMLELILDVYYEPVN